MINGINNSLGIAGGFAFLYKMQKIEDEWPDVMPEALPEPAAASSLVSTPSASNVMSQNFYNTSYQKSKYIKNSLETTQQEANYANKMASVVTSLISQAAVWNKQRSFGGDIKMENTYVIGNRLNAVSSSTLDFVKKEETTKEAQKNLDDMKDELERKAAEALSPRDENGELIEAVSTEGANNAAPVSDASGSHPAPAADASGSDAASSPVPDVSVASASDVAEVASLATDVPTMAPPSAPSIDIIV